MRLAHRAAGCVIRSTDMAVRTKKDRTAPRSRSSYRSADCQGYMIETRLQTLFESVAAP